MAPDRRRLTPEQKNYNDWPQIDLLSLDVDVREWVENRRTMIQRYLDGDKVDDLLTDHKYSCKEMHKILSNCLKYLDDGQISGECAFLPDSDRKDYTRTASIEKRPGKEKIGYAGVFEQLLEQQPKIRQMIHDSVMNRKQDGEINEPRIPIGTALYQKFRNSLLSAGLKGGDYPFNTGDEGHRSLYNYVDKLFFTHTRPMIKARHGKDAARRYGSGDIDLSLPTTRPLARAQMDTHIIDEIDTILIEHAWGGFTEVVTERCSVSVLLDEASRAVLGQELVLSSQPGQEDILACIYDALTPWEPMELTVPGLSYPDRSYGFSPDLVGVQWDETLFDNAWSHLAYSVTDAFMDVVGCDVNAGTVKVMNDRAIIERYFRTYTDRYVKRKLNTTGGNSKDKIRDNPEKKALKISARLEHMKQVLHVAAYDYNTTEHEGLGGRTPYQVLGLHCENPQNFIRRILPVDEYLLDKLAIRETRKVQGSLAKGTRNYVEFKGARYKNDLLVDLPELAGQEVTLIIKPKKDIRQIKAIGPKGKSLGILEVMGPWRRSAHTLKMRQEALRLINLKHVKRDGRTDPIQAMKEYYAKQAPMNKKAAAKYAKIVDVQNTTEMKTLAPPGKDISSDKRTSRNITTKPAKKVASKAGFVE